MKKIIYYINNLFISAVLIIIYIFGIGVTFIIFKLFAKDEKKKTTYWRDNKVDYKESYFESPY